MLCARCGKEKRFKGSPLCHGCAHQRSGSQLFKVKRLALVQKNMAKVKAEKTAFLGMSTALDRFFSKKREAS